MLLLLFLSIILIQVPTTYSLTREYNISITYESLKSLPGQLAIHGNGQNPLPTIVCNPGDLIKLTLTNNIKSNTTTNGTKRRRRGIVGSSSSSSSNGSERRRNVNNNNNSNRNSVSNKRRSRKRDISDILGINHNSNSDVVAINNNQIDAFSLHFHGIIQSDRDYNTTKILNGLSDGVPYLTQLPVLPGETYLYQFIIGSDQIGTYFYHSHWALSTITGHGAFIIKEVNTTTNYGSFEDNAYNTTADEPFIMMFSELWNKTDEVSVRGVISTTNTAFLGPPNYLLINGNVEGDTVFLVEQGKTYRIRIIGATVVEDVIFGIYNHNMTIIEVDGSYVKPVTVDTLEVAPGQRYSVLVTANQTPDDYNILGQVVLRDEAPTISNATAIIRYVTPSTSTSTSTDSPSPTSTDTSSTTTDLPMLPTKPTPVNLEMYSLDKQPPERSNRTFLLVAQIHSKTTGKNASLLRWTVNGVEFADTTSPLLVDLVNGERSRDVNWNALLAANSTGYDASRKTYPLRDGEVIDLVFQNSAGPSGRCDYHPWHLHGHNFWELAYGPGAYPEGLNVSKISPSSVMRDTTIAYPNPLNATLDTKCGWRLVRFVANNPGVWSVHCHIIPHMLTGLMFVFEEAIDKLPYINTTTTTTTTSTTATTTMT